MKIFCIGYPRTGTTSFGDAAEMIGLKRLGWGQHCYPLVQNWLDNDYQAIIDFLEQDDHDVYEDNPWCLPGLYPLLFARLPTSRFILTTRPVNDWIASILRVYPHYPLIGRATVDLAAIQWHGFLSAEARGGQAATISLATDRQARLTRSFLNHERNAVSFFDGTDRNRFARLSLDQEDKWQVIERLTGIAAPAIPYPWSNRASER